MTKTEAAEIILREPRWVQCEECSFLRPFDASGCRGCGGVQLVLDDEYAEACDVLEIERGLEARHEMYARQIRKLLDLFAQAED